MSVLGRFLSNIRNGCLVCKVEVNVSKSKFLISILEVLLKEGYINSYKILEKHIVIYLKYIKGKNVINKLKLCSKPTKKIYYTFKQLKSYSKMNIIFFISTNKGIKLTKDYFYLSKGLGGEVLFVIK
jgi:small subunit ribosomal protein S8